MKAIIIAAGASNRLKPLTDNIPKCMLSIKGKPIIQNAIELLRKNGIRDISVIRGYKKEKIRFPDITYFENTDFQNNNILHSLMFARQKLEEAVKTEEEVIITYSDIWYNDSVIKELLKSKKDIVSVVDIDWKGYYEGRTDHPIDEAENVIMDENRRILQIGKNVFPKGLLKEKQGEFIGLWKLTPRGCRIFLGHFDRINSNLGMIDPFQNAKEWRKAYITDIFQEMIDQEEKLYCALIEKNWMEFDTIQDFERVKKEV